MFLVCEKSMCGQDNTRDLNIECERCGLCCTGYTFWTDKNYDEFKPELDRLSLLHEYIIFLMPNRSFDNDTKEIKRLMRYHNLIPLRGENGELGISVSVKEVKIFKNSKGELGVHIPGQCEHFERIDKKASCKIYETRPVVCKEYYCKKIIDKAVQKLVNGVHL